MVTNANETIAELARQILAGTITINDVPEGRRGLVQERCHRLITPRPRVQYAWAYLDVLHVAQEPDGSCKYCRQAKITGRHNCDSLRIMAEPYERRGIKWHNAPDGTPCCCTAEDRFYGMGCR